MEIMECRRELEAAIPLQCCMFFVTEKALSGQLIVPLPIVDD